MRSLSVFCMNRRDRLMKVDEPNGTMLAGEKSVMVANRATSDLVMGPIFHVAFEILPHIFSTYFECLLFMQFCAFGYVANSCMPAGNKNNHK